MQDYNRNWYPIPGYEGLYWINCKGHIRNTDGHILSQEPSKFGCKVELRKNGQREKLLVSELIALAGISLE